MSIELWTLTIAVLTSVVCALCGSLLLVNRQSMVSEGLSHAVLPGLVIGFILFRSFDSIWLIALAATSGLLMVWLTEAIQKTGLVDGDAGLGIVFAGMFSLGVLLVTTYLRGTTFHADCIIEGELALAPLDRLQIAGFDLGPRAWVTMLAMLFLTGGFILLCYKELKVMIFDPSLASRVGLKPALLQYLWLGIVSLTTVVAFEVGGSILIVALMIAPPAAAFLLTDRLHRMLFLSVGLATVSSIAGFYLGPFHGHRPHRSHRVGLRLCLPGHLPALPASRCACAPARQPTAKPRASAVPRHGTRLRM